MDELFTPVSTTYRTSNKAVQPLLSEVKPSTLKKRPDVPAHISSADECLEVLKSEPEYDALVSVLRFLTASSSATAAPRPLAPSPTSAAIVQFLVAEIAPNYWTLLLEGAGTDDEGAATSRSADASLFTECLRSVTGINAIVAELKALIQDSRSDNKDSKRPGSALNLGILLDLLAAVLEGDHSIRQIWTASTAGLANTALRKAQAQSLVSILTGGRIVSVSAESLEVVGRHSVRAETRWTADGLEFSKWIGRNVASWAKLGPTGSELQFCSDLFTRSMSLGYYESLVKVVIDMLLLSKGVDVTCFRTVCLHQPQGSKKCLQTLLEYLSEKFLNRLELNDPKPDPVVSAAAGVIHAAIGEDDPRRAQLVTWCTSASGAGLGQSVGIRRAVVSVLAQDKDCVTTVFEKSLAQFGDELYIKHAATLQQEAHAQILLLSAGYVSRLSPIKLMMLLRSSTYLRAISNRIAATQVKGRFLGMVVGECLSTLNDTKDKKLDFHMEEMDTEEAHWLKSLAKVSDKVGPITPILSSAGPVQTRQPPKPKVASKKPRKPKPAVTNPVPKAIIEEIDSSDDEEDDDLVPYAKNSDPEDSDDDPTLVQRNKLKPPVYVRELVAFFRDSESYDKQKLALQTAPVLIRRKGSYGTEVGFHADELAGLLVGMQDKFDIDSFDDLKLQGMVALVVSQPKVMAPWFARTFFEGDYSLSQRSSVLVTLGLSARELAGFEASQYQSAASFPSKRLPQKMEQLYLGAPETSGSDGASQLKALPSTALDSIASSLASSFMAPIAAEAADATTGPDILKLQSFTARYKSKTKPKARVRPIPNTTAALLAASFFSPLTAHFQFALHSSRPLILNPGLLALYLQTLGIVIHAAGPSTLSLPQMTSELWGLLLAVRVHVLEDMGAMRGWLIAMAALLEVNGADMRRLCESQGREVVETREWVGGVFERTRGGDGGEENEVKMLAAGVLIKLGEAIEKYQALLMGDMIGFT